ncbi:MULTISPECIES: glutaredoxin-like protein NrdH [Loigolactobacillus]|uniref:Glutaredoxin-like protein NrdH n=1 Tax=Loigolactobacillus backii TaxID=375175 RepID=A0A192H3E5_9LACO|nr:MULTISPECIES: glutaredoxin-like protein NrdH [Loigolactobacillus]ANK59102.1 NrdH-redoxin [Loigolactobacillus backii]ANK62481.1 NrdH-redoxin [Loigolactobacillus backii]ANK64091.1 NrdH-redoxin [Loigolactobacillus backii]ANK67515.1 NrdH-redoxin [Loigolactobacillus backii]ANK70507.1 NrdH-redoxin [Loigolactobacillus backii]
MNNLTVYTKNGCMQCKMTERFLNSHNIPFTEHNIDQEPEYVDYLREKGFQATPVIEASDISFTGFRPDQLRQLAV